MLMLNCSLSHYSWLGDNKYALSHQPTGVNPVFSTRLRLREAEADQMSVRGQCTGKRVSVAGRADFKVRAISLTGAVLVPNQQKQLKKRRNMISSVQGSLPSPGTTAQSHSALPKSQKKIKKRRRCRSDVQLWWHPSEELVLDQLIQERGGHYFQLSREEVKDQCSQVRSEVHIREVIGPETNVFNLKNCHQTLPHALQYLKLCQKAATGKLCQFSLSSRGRVRLVAGILTEQPVGSRVISLLEEDQSQLLMRRSGVLKEVDNFLSGLVPRIKVDRLSRELIALCKMKAQLENQVASEMLQIASRPDPLHQIHLSSQTPHSSQSFQGRLDDCSFEDKYCELLLKKNLIRAFGEQPVSLLNYFRLADIREQQDSQGPVLPLLAAASQFRDYLRLYKPKLGKGEGESLKTACSACFSDLSELANPLWRCPECGVRTHRLCHPPRNKCQKCKYTRKTAQEKGHKPYCFVCLRHKEHGLSLQIIRDHQDYYAHTFCLLLSGRWRVRQSCINYQLSPTHNSPSSGRECRVCSKRGECLSCVDCGEGVHGLCAFLEGYGLSSERGVGVRCCGEEGQRRRLSLERRFRLNFDKLLYKRTEEVLGFIEAQ